MFTRFAGRVGESVGEFEDTPSISSPSSSDGSLAGTVLGVWAPVSWESETRLGVAEFPLRSRADERRAISATTACWTLRWKQGDVCEVMLRLASVGSVVCAETSGRLFTLRRHAVNTAVGRLPAASNHMESSQSPEMAIVTTFHMCIFERLPSGGLTGVPGLA